MNILNELVNGRGYAVLPISDMPTFNKLRDIFIEKINIDNLLSFSTEASEMMIKSCEDIVEELSGKEVFIQRRANTIFNLPGEDQRRQWPHYELMSGISPFTFVLWAPFHDLDDDGGVFYIDQSRSLEIIKKEHSLGLVNGPTILEMFYDQKPTQLKYGEVIVFNPFILHGNVDFDSNLARIACSVRFQSINKPLLQRNTDFLKYYKLN